MSFGSRFLREPERLDGPAGCVPRGALQLDLRIAGIPLRIQGLDGPGRAGLAERFFGFEGSGGHVDDHVEVVVRCAVAEDFVTLDTRGWDYDLDLDPRQDVVRVAGLRFLARIEREPLRAVLATCADREELPGVVENLLRIVVAYALLARGGVLVHAAGVADGDRARVFFGVSGAGKTTLSRLARAAGQRILSDDMVALVPEVGRVRILAIPFAGEFRGASRHDAPRLEGILRLRQAPDHALLPLRPSQALASLLTCTPFVNRDPWVADRLLGNLDALLRKAPAQELAFAPRAGFLDVLRAAP